MSFDLWKFLLIPIRFARVIEGIEHLCRLFVHPTVLGDDLFDSLFEVRCFEVAVLWITSYTQLVLQWLSFGGGQALSQ